MCRVDQSICVVCDYQARYRFRACNTWARTQFDRHPSNDKFAPQERYDVDREFKPGTCFNCEWFVRYNVNKPYVCDHCIYEASVIRHARNVKAYSDLLLHIAGRREERRLNREWYKHESIRSAITKALLEEDGDLQLELVNNIPQDIIEAAEQNNQAGSPALEFLGKYLAHFWETEDAGFFEMRAADTDISWVTVRQPQCPLCSDMRPDIIGHRPEFKFEPNAAAWRLLQQDRKRASECEMSCRVHLGTFPEPCARCAEREQLLRYEIEDEIKRTTSFGWIPKLFDWIKKRSRNSYLEDTAANGPWKRGSMVPPATADDALLLSPIARNNAVVEAHNMMAEKWKQETSSFWRDTAVQSRSVQLIRASEDNDVEMASSGGGGGGVAYSIISASAYSDDTSIRSGAPLVGSRALCISNQEQ
ncbi:hypothetical protein B0T26DRAFT_670331 [Lasiosphaeria miniovina]|uniref:Uncharacterized protein n=1 Tax=Lasiosphaeria miniovina TaxID=1954250 RepID=A0AA40BGW4_9PEZI|nr:uncharacterized protein B0T26DRAFT_670331 [Lasiosphaeria miniovina]KAK0733993.1 hypothetical protein B0T26DRAFT_670331 [Lasiosphaeria miniovina]